ncbi:oxygenase MpaB family protein [Glycomyces sp. NPDC048151]|uniref:oxygenase MpaB family protein n=1 Tax=Glycomyces sp. NPDC048151 TaxID=3364002 RepID=UPI0037114ABC
MEPSITRRTALTALAAGAAAAADPAGLVPGRTAEAAGTDGWVLAGEPATREGDPEADRLIESLYADNQVEQLNAAFKTWTRNDQPVPDGAPAEAAEFLQAHAVLTAEEQAITDGFTGSELAKFVQANMEALSVAEGCGGLFTALADPLLAKSVYYAKFDLVADIGRRFSRTFNTLWDGLGDGNWAPEGNAVVSLGKLRLVHAAARHMALRHGWDAETDGTPISQRLKTEEIMYVTMYNVGLAAKNGVDMTRTQIDELASMSWVAGRLLGIDPKYNPRTYEQSEAVIADSRAYRGWSAEGKELAHNMLEWMDRKFFPGAGAIGGSLVKHFDEEVADILEIKTNPVTDAGVRTLAPLMTQSAHQVQLQYPLLVPLHAKMFDIASKMTAWYAVDFRDYDLQLPTGRPATASGTA